MMKRVLLLFFAIGLTLGTTAMASMSTSEVRRETRFLTDKMAHELGLNSQQYNDIYEINYDFVSSIRHIMDDVVRGEEWAMDDYYEALDVRNDDLRWVLGEGQYRRFMKADYFYRPIYVTGARWSFRVYVNYPNRSLFYFGTPHHYRTYCGAHYRPHIHHVSFYRGRYTNVGHYPVPHRVRDARAFHTYRRSDFGSVNFRPNSSVRPNNAPTRPGISTRPNGTNRPRPEIDNRPSRPSVSNRPSMTDRPSRGDRPSRSTTTDRPSRGERPSREVNSGSSDSGRRTSGGSSRSERSHVSGRSSERRSSSESTRGSSNRSSSHSSERENNARR